MTTTKTTETFNSRVKEWIDEKHRGNVSQAARISGVPRNTLWQIYRGLTQTPAATVLVRISDSMGVTIDWLLTGKL